MALERGAQGFAFACVGSGRVRAKGGGPCAGAKRRDGSAGLSGGVPGPISARKGASEHLGGQVLGLECLAPAHGGSELERVLKLAHITRPVIREERSEGIG